MDDTVVYNRQHVHENRHEHRNEHRFEIEKKKNQLHMNAFPLNKLLKYVLIVVEWSSDNAL